MRVAVQGFDRLLVALALASMMGGCGGGLSAATAPAPGSAQGKADSYGTDDRKNVRDLPDGSKVHAWARSVAVVLKASELIADGPGHMRLPSVGTSRRALNLCSDVPFADEPYVYGATAFLAAPNKVVMAGHSLGTFPCGDLAVVFGYEMTGDPSHDPRRVATKDVYYCARSLAAVDQQRWQRTTDGRWLDVLTDYGVIELDRPVTDRPHLTLSPRGRVAQGAKVVAIGHPWGLPVKATEATVRNTDPRLDIFLAPLDVFRGNSGSPVINMATGLVEGVAVWASDAGFLETPAGCNTYRTCDRFEPDFATNVPCRGVGATYAELFADLVD